ncbi:hypothetical protein GCM10010483_48700 [Actinokineospora diospyrosa]
MEDGRDQVPWAPANTCWAMRSSSRNGSVRINIVPPPVLSVRSSTRTTFLTCHHNDDNCDVAQLMTYKTVVTLPESG